MTRKTRLILLSGILVVTVGAAVGVSLSEKAREDIRESGEVVFELPADTATAVSWTYTDEDGGTVSLSFRKDGDWLYDGDEAFPVDAEKLQELLDQFAQLRAAFVIEDVTDYAQYGLEDPICSIDITAGETDYEILVGDYSEMDSQRYLSLGDGSVYLVNEDPMDVYEATLDDFLRGDDIPAFAEVESVAFGGAEDQTIRRDENGDSYRKEDDYYLDGRPLDTDKLDSYLSHLSGMSLNDYATYKAAEADLAEYGLDDPELTVTVEYPDLETEETEIITVAVSRAPADRETPWSEVAAALGSEDEDASAYEDSAAYLRMGESTIIYEISYEDLAQIMACTYDDLRHSEILPAEFEDVQSLTVTLDGQSYTFTRTAEAGEDTDAQWTYGEEEADLSGVENALTALSASSFESGTAGEAEISLTAVLDLDGSPEIGITLYRADGESCVAEVDGEQIGTVPRSQAVDLIEAVNAIVLN